MQAGQLFDYLPLWGLFFATVLVILLSVEGGFRLGRYRRRRNEHEQHAPVGSIVGATLGLLALMLAFTFGRAISHYDARRHLVLDEANAIGATYLRAELLPKPQRTEIRKLLREYVTVRVKDVQTGEIEHGIARSEELQDRLWSEAVALSEKDSGSIVAGLFIQSLNEVIDLHAKRVTAGIRTRIPGSIWVALIFVAMLAMAAMGYHAGLTGTRGRLVVFVVVLTFSVVILLIADVDRRQEGLIKVSQQAMVDLQNKLTMPKR
jgi:hypothetical protein